MVNYFKKILKKIYKISSYFYSSIKILFLKKKDFNYIDIVKGIKKERLPRDIVKTLSRGIRVNNSFLAGTEIVIKTNAVELDVLVKYKKKINLSHMSTKATSGIDFYYYNQNKDNKYEWIDCLYTKNAFSMFLSNKVKLEQNNNEIKIISVFLPPFANIDKLFIGVKKDYELIIKDNKKDKIIAYGSSITQGCAASRPRSFICELY